MVFGSRRLRSGMDPTGLRGQDPYPFDPTRLVFEGENVCIKLSKR